MRAVSILTLLAVASCSSPAPVPAGTPEDRPQPSQAAAETFQGCDWQEVRGQSLSIWSYACGPDFGNTHLAADDSLPGFRLVSDGAEPGQTASQPVIRVFTKPADAPIDAVLPAVRAASPGPDSAACTFQPAADPARAGQVYHLAPTGEARIRWEGNVESGEDPTPPCGEMGVALVGDRVFQVMAADPDKVVYVDYGSEIQIFDAATLKSINR